MNFDEDGVSVDGPDKDGDFRIRIDCGCTYGYADRFLSTEATRRLAAVLEEALKEAET